MIIIDVFEADLLIAQKEWRALLDKLYAQALERVQKDRPHFLPLHQKQMACSAAVQALRDELRRRFNAEPYDSLIAMRELMDDIKTGRV